MIYFIFYYLFLLWYGVNFLSFSIIEVKGIENLWLLRYLYDFSFYLFGKSDLALRMPSIFFSALSLIIFYSIARERFKKPLLVAVLFSLIPGFIISSLIINKSVYLIFLTLLFIYTYIKYPKISYILLIAYVFVDYSFIALYFSLIFYAIYKKDGKMLIFVLLLLAVNANYFDYVIKGKPKGYFLDVLGTYILIFSPLVFVYFVYALYKGVFYKKDIVFFISFFTFFLSVILSFRQRIKIDDYAPFVLPYVLNMVQIFYNSYKVRLPVFRKGYKILAAALMFSLVLFDGALFFNKYTPAKNLSGSFYFIKPLVKKIKYPVYCNNAYLCEALYFYGVKKGGYYLHYAKSKNEVSIFHNGRLIEKIDVSKLNTL
ncbi:MAG: glycosyltransferase family 39 protein [Epsilonproteobacteria bacterium]|nr:glycosyltransferase family 39 protein [Campylobacterota bacterium]